MKTTLKKERELRDIKTNCDLEELASKGSLIPGLYIRPDMMRASDVIFCESISGNAKQIGGMPQELSLTRLVNESSDTVYNNDSEISKYEAKYIQVNNKDIDFIGDINTSSIEGQLLISALAFITTSSRMKNTPDEVLEEITKLKNKIYKENE